MHLGLYLPQVLRRPQETPKAIWKKGEALKLKESQVIWSGRLFWRPFGGPAYPPTPAPLSALMDTKEIQELFQEINLERPPKRRKLFRSILLEPASRTEGASSNHSLPSKRAREEPNVESNSISTSHLVPIGGVGFDSLFVISNSSFLHQSIL